MLKISTRTRLLGATAIAALMLAGCGKKDKDEATDTATQTVTKSDKAPKGKSPIDEKFVYKEGQPLDMDGFTALMSSEGNEKFAFASSEFDDKIGAQVLQDVTINAEDGGLVTAGRVELYGVNTDYIQRLKDDQVSDTKEQVFRKIRVFDISMTPELDEGETGSFSIGALEIDNFKLGGFDPEELEAAEDEAGERMSFAAVAKGMELGGVYMRDMTMNISGIEAGGDLVMSLKDARYGGFDSGKVGAVLIRGLDYDMTMTDEMRDEAIAANPAMSQIAKGPLKAIMFPDSQQMSIGELSWDGMSFAGLLTWLEKGEEPPLDADKLITFGAMEFHDMSSKMSGKDYSTSEYARMEPIEFAWLIPSRIETSGKGEANLTALVPDEETEMLSVFSEMGLDKLKSDSKFLWDWDDKAGDAKLVYDAKMKNFADVDFDLNMSEAKLDTLYTAAKEGNEMAFMNIALNGFTLKIDDEKLLDTVFAVAAHQTGQEASALRSQATAMVTMGSMQLTQMNPAFGDYATAINAFLTDGGTLEITMAPEEPVTLGAVAMSSQMSPQTIPDVLGLKVTHSK